MFVLVVLLSTALVAAVHVQEKKNLDMCTVCTGVVSEFKHMLQSGASAQQTIDSMLTTGCAAFGVNEPEVRAATPAAQRFFGCRKKKRIFLIFPAIEGFLR